MAETYLQCAGSANALSIELRQKAAGAYHLYTVGRPGVRRGKPGVAIPFQHGNRTLQVYPDEVFVAEEAAEIFHRYFKTGEVDTRYLLREIDLNAFYRELESDSDPPDGL
ncbi:MULTISPECIES: hypothetical protein [Rhodococcus]|uniref:Uncharacterized protein n=1 Tax=Rhodococcus oxybenzonivorans TaxID=1990687 RepID=A0AAE4UY97_9NOCA|nr:MULTISPECIES: hypothetical protein [Rhodococcus]MDV7243460.1 hypothetical protein [Rhodococcus oxybenzonivorans]MDV7265166.1 hypothetical protein [Rhodococcus oxybenzonivorans]MDV7277436.1 hypothetical protein [Rhodococcus oxybenzonivorans]MDV7335536.1 hypothetical protein [Rhodococcus oxybenzonivorans]MDV7347148.1 hypothetical protein [Rhodococcus oxybenzonivorans]